jgi:hypothetical protein
LAPRVRVFVIATQLVALSAVARANPASLVPEPGAAGPGELFVDLNYEYEQDSSHVMREEVGPSVPANGPIPVEKDLVFHQTRHTITPQAELGLSNNVWLYAALPIVVDQTRQLAYDDGVTAANSSTIASHLLPASGFDAQAPSSPPPDGLAFRGVNRNGLDQVHLGLALAPMNQAHDSTKPTWKLGVEARLAVGGVMKFDPTTPSANTNVGTGVDEVRAWTSYDRKLGWAEPWFEAFWQAPFAVTSDSLFQNPGYGAIHVMPPQQAGAAFGLEVYAIDDPHDHNRVSLDLGGSMVAHFDGREYTEMWEVFSYAGSTSKPSNPLILDGNPTATTPQPLAYPGISNIENYLETSARIAIRGELGTHVRFTVLTDLIWKTDHAITFAVAGVNNNGTGVIDPGTAQVNPLYVDLIDLVGHRYISVDNFDFVLGVQGMVLF